MYTPKNRILTDLYTRNNKLIISSSGDFYNGYYHKFYNGKMYTGKTPNEKPNYELIEVEPTDEGYSQLTPQSSQLPQTELAYTDAPTIFESLDTPGYSEEMVIAYARTQGINLNEPQRKFLPYQYYPTPTPEEYELGVFDRYFCFKINEMSYLELNKEVYEKLVNKDSTYQWELFTPFKIPWTLKGERNYVRDTNMGIIFIEERRNGKAGLNAFLRGNYLKFYQP